MPGDSAMQGRLLGRFRAVTSTNVYSLYTNGGRHRLAASPLLRLTFHYALCISEPGRQGATPAPSYCRR